MLYHLLRGKQELGAKFTMEAVKVGMFDVKAVDVAYRTAETLVANLAWIELLSGVDALVNGQVARRGKTFVAYITVVEFSPV